MRCYTQWQWLCQIRGLWLHLLCDTVACDVCVAWRGVWCILSVLGVCGVGSGVYIMSGSLLWRVAWLCLAAVRNGGGASM